MVDPNAARAPGLHQWECHGPAAHRFLRRQHLLHALQDQRLRRASFGGRARLEPPIHRVRNVDCRPHGFILPYLWLSENRLAPFGHDSGCCKRSNFFHPATFQHHRAGLQRRPGGGDVVNEDDGAGTGDRGSGIRAELEGVFHILTPLFPWQFDLRWRVNDAPQERPDRHAQMPGKIIRLIEASLVFAARVKWDWYDEVGIAQEMRAGRAHQRS